MTDLPLTLLFELYVDGSWVDITSDVRQTVDLSIEYGRSNESDAPNPASFTAILDNTGGKYSPRNPLSPYYGKLKRNTPIRVSIVGTSGYRFTGEVSEWPPRWNTTNSNATVPIDCGGLLRRVGQSKTDIRSSLRTWINTLPADWPLPVAYWPMEDGALSTECLPDIGATSIVLTDTILAANQRFQKGELSDWLPNVFALYGNDIITGQVDMAGVFAPIDGWAVSYVFAGTGDELYLTCRLDCAKHDWIIACDMGFDQIGVILPFGAGTYYFDCAFPLSTGAPILLNFNPAQDGSDIVFDLEVVNLETGEVDGISYFVTGIHLPVRTIQLASSTLSQEPLSLGHVAVWPAWWGAALEDITPPARGYVGEVVVDRLFRLCLELGIPAGAETIPGSDGGPMGPQFPDTFPALLAEIERTDSGLLREYRNSAELRYKQLEALRGQDADVVLDYAAEQIAPPLEPTDDDRFTRNAIVAEKRSGGSVTVEKTTGPVQVGEPIDGGVGRYEAKVELNPANDTQLISTAYWHLARGTIDEPRYSKVTVNLLGEGIDDDTYDALLAVDVGGVIRLTGMAAVHVYDDVSLLVLGYSETLSQYTHVITFNCVPESIFHPFKLQDTALGFLDSDDTTTNEDLDTTETGITCTVTGALWSAANQPYDLMIGGERMRVTAVSGASSPQTFTVTRSVNGVVKEHDTGAAVVLADPVYLGV